MQRFVKYLSTGKAHRQVHRFHVLGQCADRNPVDAGFSDGVNAFQTDVPRGFQHRPTGVERDGIAQHAQAEIVEQDHLGAGFQRACQFIQTFHFDLDETATLARLRSHGARLLKHRSNAAGGENVVFLDQDGVPQGQTVAAATADANRVFLGQTQAGQGLARIDHLRFGIGDGIGVKARLAGHGREHLQKVEGAAFAGEQGAGVAFDAAEQLVGLDAVAVPGQPFDFCSGIEAAETALEPGTTAKHAGFARDDGGAAGYSGGNEIGGEVAGADILGKGGSNVAFDFGGEQGQKFNRHLAGGQIVLDWAHCTVRESPMSELLAIFQVSLGVAIALTVGLLLAYWYVRDITQKRHTVLRNYPIIGHLRFFFERLGEYFRQYFFLGDRDEMPFNRATRSWVYRLAKNEGGMIGFGSTYDLMEPGAILFVNAPFAVLEEDKQATPPLLIGEDFCQQPFVGRSLVNISGMSFGAISAPAVRALSRGAAAAGCWLDTGEGGLSPHHLEGGCDIVFQVGTAKYGVRDELGRLDPAKLREIAAHENVRAFEIKLSQGAKPGKGGVLPASKVTAEIAAIRGIPLGKDSFSPNRHPETGNMDELLDMVERVRDLTGKPVGVKTAIGGWAFLHELTEAVARRGLHAAPDFLAIDGGEGGSGAAPQALADHMALSILEGLPRTVDALLEAGLKQRIRVIAAGKLVTPAKAAWAIACGADFVNTARGFLFSLGCIQALRCHTNTCPTGITTHNPRLQRGLVVEDKAERVAHYCRNMNHEMEMIAHACGLKHPRELRREHVRIMQPNGHSEALSTLFPYPSIRV